LKVKIPILFLGGTCDIHVVTPEIEKMFDRTASKTKAYANAGGFEHAQNSYEYNLWSPYTTNYMACHIK